MRYWILIILLTLTSLPSFADDVPDITQVARFGRGTAHTLAWRPDGEVLAVGSSTGVWFFDEDFNEVGNIPTDHTIDQIEWSPDGKWLALGHRATADSTCYTTISEISDDFESRVLAVPSICASSMDWRYDGEYLAIGTFDTELGDSEVVIFDSQLFAIHQYVDIGAYVAFSPDGQYLATGHFMSKIPIKIIEVQSGNVIHQISGKEAGGRPLWSSDGNYIATHCFDETFRYYGDGNCIWNINTQELVFANEPSILWNPVNNRFLTVETSFWGSPDRATFIGLHQDFSDDAVTTSVLPDIVHKVVWHPSGEFFITLAFGQGISQFDGQTGDLIAHHGLFQPMWDEITWIPNTTELLSISSPHDDQNSTVQVWSIDSESQYKPERNQLIGDIDEIQWIKNTQNFIVHSAGGMGYYWTNIWDANTLEHVDMIYEHFDQENTIPTYRFASDMSRVAIYAPDYREHIEIVDDLYSRENPVEIHFQADRLRQIEWSPDDSMIATAGTVGEIDISHFLIEFWDAETGKIVSSIGLEWLQHFNQFIWNPNDRSIAVLVNRPTGSGCDLSVDIYTIPFNDIYQPLPSIQADFQAYERGANIDPIYPYCRVPSATWSPDGQLIALSFGNGVRIYNPQENILLAEISTQWIHALDWHESGQYLAGGASDGTIYVWDVSALMEQ